MKNIIFNIAQFIDKAFCFFFFLAQLVITCNYKNRLKKKYSGTVAVMANGPSLKKELSRFEKAEEIKNIDFIVLNYFAFDDIFFKIKPKHYCLSDPMFFYENYRIEDVRKLYKLLDDKVDWSLNIYIPSYRYKQFKEFAQLTNKNMNIVRVNTLVYTGFNSFQNYFYKKGLAMPHAETVAILAIYVGLMIGYSELKLYGVDHTFFEGLTVDKNNRLCVIEKHFYETESIVKPLLRSDNNQPWTMVGFLNEKMRIFKSHEQLNSFANYLNRSIVNYTVNSLIDSYKKTDSYE